MYANAAAAADEEREFDLEAEIEAVAQTGYVFPEPIVERVLEFSDLVRAVGFAAALDLTGDTFEGWEVEFLAVALGILASEARGQELLEQYRLWARVLGAAR